MLIEFLKINMDFMKQFVPIMMASTLSGRVDGGLNTYLPVFRATLHLPSKERYLTLINRSGTGFRVIGDVGVVKNFQRQRKAKKIPYKNQLRRTI